MHKTLYIKKVLFSILCVVALIGFCWRFVPAEELLVKEKFFASAAQQLFADDIGYIYEIHQSGNVIKRNEKGDTIYTYEEKAFPVEFCDVSNPLKILAFNSRLNSLQFLDKTLAPMNATIELDDLEIPVSKAVAKSRDNLFWVFDENTQELKKYGINSKEIFTSGNLVNITGMTIQANYMIEQAARVYVVDSLKGVFEFDHLGTFLFHHKKIKCEKMDLVGGQYLYLNKGKLFVYDPVLLESSELQLKNISSITDFAASKGKLYILSEQKISIFQSDSLKKN